MVVKLVGSPISTCTKRAVTVLLEKKVDFEFVPIDFSKGEHKAPEFVAKQPFGQVPYLDDDGFIVYESRAIARYVAEKWASQGTPLLPLSDIKKKALFEQAASVETANFDAHAATAVFEKLFKPFFGLPADLEAYDAQIKKLDAKLDAYEVILGKQKYLAGDELTLADLFHLPYATLLIDDGYEGLTKRTNVARWWKDISSRPAWLSIKDGIKASAPAPAPVAAPAPTPAPAPVSAPNSTPAAPAAPPAQEKSMSADAALDKMTKTERDKAYLAAQAEAAKNKEPFVGGPWAQTKHYLKGPRAWKKYL